MGMTLKKLDRSLVVLYGGRSGEFEVSLRSASSVLRALSRVYASVRAIEVDRQGAWREVSEKELGPFLRSDEILKPLESPVIANITEVLRDALVFPLIHGTTGEDGVVQGFLEWLNVPYVGCGVSASSIAMDKDLAKRLVAKAGLAVTPGNVVERKRWVQCTPKERLGFAEEIGFPVFVKPARSGSSVATYKVKSAFEFIPAMEGAFQYDTKVLVEKAIHCREIELAVLERASGELFVSTPGELTTTHEFYSYEAKYLDEKGAEAHIPALISKEMQTQARKLGEQVFRLLGCQGLARVDLFLNKDDNKFIFNEINTMPGFTSISMYPKMCIHDGIEFETIVDELVINALEKYETRSQLSVDLPSGLVSGKNT